MITQITAGRMRLSFFSGILGIITIGTTLYWSNSVTAETPGWTCGDEFTDTRDNKTYATVQIGTQCWMRENLNVGAMITSCSGGYLGACTNNGEMPQNQGTDCSNIQKYCYDDVEANCTTRGGLYQWNQAMCGSIEEGGKGICPLGWHIPTDAEQHILENFLTDEGATCNPGRSSGDWDCATAGAKMKAASPFWDGNNTSGFAALPAGDRRADGRFLNAGTYKYFWSSSQSSTNAFFRYLFSTQSRVHRAITNKETSYSVRCLRDADLPFLSVVTPVPTPTNNPTPTFTFSTTKAGTITYGGACTSATTLAATGSNIITFHALPDGTYSNCTITVTDSAENASDPLAIASFTIDTQPPTLSSTAPANNATNVSLTTTLAITFDESIGMTGTGYVTIHKASDDSVVERINTATGAVTGSGTTTMTLQLDSALENDTTYYVMIDAMAFYDLGGNRFGGITESTAWTFTTTDGEWITTPHGYQLRASHPRVVMDSAQLATVIDRMYGPNAREPYKTWFDGMKASHNIWNPTSEPWLYMLTAALIYRTTGDSEYKDRFVNNIPATGAPRIEESYAWDLLWNELTDELKLSLMQRVADAGPHALGYNSVSESNKEPSDSSLRYDYYSPLARALAYSGLFAHTDLEKNKDPELFPFNADNYVAIAAYQLSDDGYFYKFDSRFGGDPTYNDALPGSYGGMYDNFDYDMSMGNSAAPYLVQTYKTLTGVERNLVRDVGRGAFYQTMTYPYKGTHRGVSPLMDTWRTRSNDISAASKSAFIDLSALVASYYQDSRMQWFVTDQLMSELASNYRRNAMWLLFYDDTLAVDPPDTNPTSIYFNGPGLVPMRADWQTDAATGVFYAGEGISRRYEDGNSFILGRNVDVAVHPGARLIDAAMDWTNASLRYTWYSKRSISRNTIQIYDPNESHDIQSDGTTGDLNSGVPLASYENYGGQMRTHDDNNLPNANWDFPLGIRETSNVIKYEHNPDQGYTYTVGDSAAAYTKKIDLFQREFLFIRPDVFVVFDRVNSVDPSFKKVWTVHATDEPVIDGTPDTIGLGMNSYDDARTATITNADNITYLDTLLPDSNRVVIRGGETLLTDAQPLDAETPIELEDFLISELDIPRILNISIGGTDTVGSLTVYGDTDEHVGTSEVISFATTTYKNSTKYWTKITSITTEDMTLSDVTVAVAHHVDIENAAGTLYSFSPYDDGRPGSLMTGVNLGQWNLSVEATQPKNLDNFLNVFSLKDPGVARPQTMLLEADGVSGVLVDSHFAVFANDQTNIQSTSIDIPYSGAVNGLFLNLDPNTTYYYDVTGNTVELAQTNNGGSSGQSSDMGTLQIAVVVETQTPPVLSVVTACPTPTNNPTPSFTFSTTKAGTITYGGACTSTTTLAATGSNVIIFNALPDGTYGNCTITVTDAALNTSNPLAINTFIIDTQAPTLFSTTPADNAISVSTTANLVLTFSEAVDPESGNIIIKKTSDNSTVETIAVTSGQVTGGGTDTITINPSVTLANSTEYYVLIDATAFDDSAGNSYTGISTTTAWSFTTAAAASSAASSVPSSSATPTSSVAPAQTVTTGGGGGGRRGTADASTLHFAATAAPSAMPGVFRDVPASAWYAPFIAEIVERGIASGYADARGRSIGIFGPARPVSFGEIAKMALEAADKSPQLPAPLPENRRARRHWSMAYIARAETLKFPAYTPTLNPDDSASRGAVIETLLAAFEIPLEDAPHAFRDLRASHRHAKAIATAAKLGIIIGDTGRQGEPTGTVRPNDPINRAEVAKIIALLLQ